MLMNSFRFRMCSPALPSRSKLAQSVAITQSNLRQAQFRTNAVPVRPHVADDTDGLTLANPVEDALDDARLHSTGEMDFSSSAMMARTRLPRTTESSTTKRSCGVYLRMTDLATRPWMRVRCLWS